MVDIFGTPFEEWSSREQNMWGDFSDFGVTGDVQAETLFHEAYFNFDLDTETINAIRDAFDGYMMEEYGIDFDAVFDWEAYREAYG